MNIIERICEYVVEMYYIAKINQAIRKEDRLYGLSRRATEFALELTYAFAERYSIPVQDVLVIFDKINYWDVINNDAMCCMLRDKGIDATMAELEKPFHDALYHCFNDNGESGIL